MHKLKMKATKGLTFEEDCNKYLEYCRQRNLRQGTINHYRQSYVQFFKFFEPYTPIEEIDEGAYIAAIADIDADALNESAKEFNIAPENCYTSAEELLSQPKLANILCICTPDDCHVSQAVAALKKGYHLLLEKPIATTSEDCRKR